VADRFIPSARSVDALANTLETVHLGGGGTALAPSSPGHTARLAAAAGVNPSGSGRRILAYHVLPPAAKDPLLAGARAHAAPLHARAGSGTTSASAAAARSRAMPGAPERVLDAPGILDDFYLNVLAWSPANVLAVGLGDTAYAWAADSGDVAPLATAPEGSTIASVAFSGDGAFLGVGLGTGAVELWDVAAQKRLRVMGGHQAQVASLSWSGHVLSSGCHDGSIWHHDVRVGRHKVAELLGHAGEVCGLTWRGDGALLASGGNDNVVNMWDARLVQDEDGARGVAKWTKRNHTAAVKVRAHTLVFPHSTDRAQALAWCPWQPALLASGGGTNDAAIHIWNSTTGARVHTLATPAQVTALVWAPGRKELLSTHGYPTNALMVHAYPSLEKVGEVRDAHDQRILYAALGPGGDVVCTGAGDENLKFWRVWDAPAAAAAGAKGGKRREGEGRTDGGVLGIR
jgi:cell division cycle protein 20 (cofactor of APC complex)